jgi:hypothetical protein
LRMTFQFPSAPHCEIFPFVGALERVTCAILIVGRHSHPTDFAISHNWNRIQMGSTIYARPWPIRVSSERSPILERSRHFEESWSNSMKNERNWFTWCGCWISLCVRMQQSVK